MVSPAIVETRDGVPFGLCTPSAIVPPRSTSRYGVSCRTGRRRVRDAIAHNERLPYGLISGPPLEPPIVPPTIPALRGYGALAVRRRRHARGRSLLAGYEGAPRSWWRSTVGRGHCEA